MFIVWILVEHTAGREEFPHICSKIAVARVIVLVLLEVRAE